MHTNFIQLPPDSTGKKLLVQRTILLTVDNSALIREGDIIYTSVTHNTLRVTASVVVGSVHMLHAMVVDRSAELVDAVQVGESITVSGVYKCITIAPTPYYEFFNTTSVVSSDNPYHGQVVDASGAANVRFAEGAPGMTAFGGLRTSTGHTIGVYDYSTDSADELFSDRFVGTGELVYDSDSSTVSLNVGSESGAFAGRTSNKYHFYWPGNGNLLLMTVALSDSSHVGCERRWGLFDANDGVYFDLDEAGVLQVSLRTSVTGSVVKEHFPRTEWNVDKVDGTGLSRFILDLTKVNIYWIDYQWLGGGRVRFGVVDSTGARIVCHAIENANSHILPYMSRGSLPLQINIENMALTGGAASIRMTCAVVQTEGEVENYTYWRYSYAHPTVAVTGNNIPMMAVKAKATWGGKHNSTTALPETYACYVSGGPIKVDLYWDTMVYTGATWAVDNGSTVVADIAATATTLSTQVIMKTFYLDIGVHELDLRPMFEVTDVAINANADESEPLHIALIATKISGSPTVEGALNYRELR